MIVVSDTSCLTNLIRIGLDHLIPDLFGEVFIPSAVRRELARTHAVLPGYLRMMEVPESPELVSLRLILDEGEAQSIVLARNLHADRLLMDEAKGRAAATRAGLVVTGVVGVLILAKKSGLIPQVAGPLADLRTKAGFWLSDALVRAACQAAGE